MCALEKQFEAMVEDYNLEKKRQSDEKENDNAEWKKKMDELRQSEFLLYFFIVLFYDEKILPCLN